MATPTTSHASVATAAPPGELPGRDPAQLDNIRRSYRPGPPGNLPAFLMTLVKPGLALAVNVGLALLYVLAASSGG
jgi:hypothetical protein